MDNKIILGSRYRHFKGNEYLILHIAKDTETEEEFVVYKQLYGDEGIWIRPLKVFSEIIEKDGQKFERYARICD